MTASIVRHRSEDDGREDGPLGDASIACRQRVDAILVGKDRAYNRVRQCLSDHWRSIGSLQQMCGHYLVEPVACTPASGWEKGQVENQVGVIRRRFFVPRPRFKSYAELNAWLLDRCVAWAKTHPHPELRERSTWEVFEAERGNLVPYAGPFDHRPAGDCAAICREGASTPCRHRSPRPASCGLTPIATR